MKGALERISMIIIISSSISIKVAQVLIHKAGGPQRFSLPAVEVKGPSED